MSVGGGADDVPPEVAAALLMSASLSAEPRMAVNTAYGAVGGPAGSDMSTRTTRSGAADAGYAELPGDHLMSGQYDELSDAVVSGAGCYDQLPTNLDQQTGVYDQLPHPEDVAGQYDALPAPSSKTGGMGSSIVSPKQQQQLRKEREEQLAEAQRLGQQQRVLELKALLKQENQEKRLSRKEQEQLAKKKQKEEKKQAEKEKKAAKKAEKNELKAMTRRMTASKKELAAKAKRLSKDDLAKKQEEMVAKLRQSALDAETLDLVDIEEQWKAAEPTTRYKALKNHRTTKPGYLDFVKDDRIIIIRRGNDVWYTGRNLRTGKSGVFLSERVMPFQ
eukprot:m.481036 g.481036  ORF g.481036 m.481036 type:complete len:333 (+) comp22029_c0_seq1:1779-2777(+)